MAVENTEATLPGTGTTEDRDGKASWSNPTNIQAEANTASCGVTASTYSDWLRASNFGFQIPIGSTINGIIVQDYHSASALSCIKDSALYLVDSSGVNTGDNKADTGTYWLTIDTPGTYGSSSDLWGATWEYYQINDPDFGIRLSVSNTDVTIRTASVHWVTITVYYTPQVTDYKTPIHCTTQTRTGSAVAWTNYSRAETSDNYYAEASVPTSSYTDWLRVDEFQFDADDMPASTQVTGINVKIERKAGITANLSDSSLYLRTASGQISSDGASATTWTTTDTEVVYYWDLVGESLYEDDIYDTDFGVELSVACDADAETVAYVDCISIRVFYVSIAGPLTAVIQDLCNEINEDTSQSPSYSTYWRGQTFTASSSYKITSVELKLYRMGSPGTLTVGIYATSGDLPTGTALCSGTTDGDTLPTGSPYEWREITLGAGFQLTQDVKYAIALSAPGGSLFNWVYWRYRPTSGEEYCVDDTYSRGYALWSNDSGSSWNSYSPWDFYFVIYGISGGAEPGFLLMETGEFLLLEISGDKILLESIGGAAYFRIISTELTLSPTVSRLAAWDRTVTSNFTLASSLTRVKGFARTITSNLTLATTVSRVVDWVRSIAPQITLSPTISRVVDWTRATINNLTLDPIIIVRKVNDYIVTITTNLTVAATVARKWGAKRAISASLTLSPTISRVVTWTRSTTSNLTLATTVSRVRGVVRTITTNLTTSPTVSRVVAWVRSPSPSITVSPTIVITALVKLLRVLVAAGSTHIINSAEGNIYRMKTATGNVYLFKMAAGAIYRVKNIAGRIYQMITRES